MKSPHKQGWGPYEDPFAHRTLPPEEESLIAQGYKFLGWQMAPGHGVPEYSHCVNEGHNYAAHRGGWENKQHTNSGSDCTYWCTTCKIYWKIDMSD